MSQLRHCLGVVRRCAYAFLAQRLPALWYRRSLSPWLWPLLPFSWLFCLLLALRSGCFRVGLCRTQSLPVPVIVVGNLSVGGTGKTPLVLWLAEALLARGWRVGIVSRGYGGDGGYGAHGQSADPSALHQALPESDPAQVGDEPLLLARRSGAPVFVGRDRVAAGRALLAAYPECAVILSDDGLQHRRLGRLIELCVFGARGVGNGHLLPAGPLRATLASYFCLPKSNPDPDPDPLLQPNILRAVIWHGAADPRLAARLAKTGNIWPQFAMRLRSQSFVALNDTQRFCSAETLRGRRLYALAGIGDPARFFQQLSDLGLSFVARAFPDHHPYCLEDLAFARDGVLLMTEKDAVKCAALCAHTAETVASLPVEAWFLPVHAELLAIPLAQANRFSPKAEEVATPSPDLLDLILEKLNGYPSARHPSLPDL